MSEKIIKPWSNMGELDTNSNRVQRDARGAIEMENIGDLAGDGSVEILPGYIPILSTPILASYSTGSVAVSNGSKNVVGTSTRFVDGPITNIVTNGTFTEDLTGWTYVNGAGTTKWFIVSGGGYAQRIITGSDFTFVSVSAVPVVGYRYKLIYIINPTAGAFTVTCGGATWNHVSTGGGVTYTRYFTATTTAALTFTANAAGACGLAAVSMTVVLPGACRGDLFNGPDGVQYEIADVVSNTALTLTTEYEGVDASAQAYSVLHKVWMIAPMRTQILGSNVSKEQLYYSNALGTHTGTAAYSAGTSVAPTIHAGTIQPKAYVRNISLSSYEDPSQVAQGFTLAAGITGLKGIHVRVDTYHTPITYKVTIQSNSAGRPSGTVLATSGTITDSTQYDKITESKYYFPFTVAVDLTAGVVYHVVVTMLTNPYSNSFYSYRCRIGSPPSGGLTLGNLSEYKSGAWGADPDFARAAMMFSILQYPTTAKTYKAEVIDLGATPVGDSTVSIIKAMDDDDAEAFSGGNFAVPQNFASQDANTITWTMAGSASPSMSAPTTVVSSTSALTALLTTGKWFRYYQITFTITSATGESTDAICLGTVWAQISTLTPTDLNLLEIVGCGPYVFKGISNVAAVLNYSTQTALRPAAWALYNNDFYYRTPGTLLRYWDGITTLDAAVADKTKVDGSAGADPMTRATCLVVHNDKLITAGYVGVAYDTGVSTTITETVLTDSGATWVTAGTGMLGWKLRPDVNWQPEQWKIITANTATAATCAGALLITDAQATLGDTFEIVRFYPKHLWYSTEAEPADHPSLNFLMFNAADGDLVQQVVSHNGNLLVICNEQVWLVRGYGASTPWQKSLLSDSSGTIAPMSVVNTPYDVYWWSEEGIVKCPGGTGVPVVIDSTIRDITINAVNPLMRHNIVGAWHQGRIYWSYPSVDSNVNDTTMIYDPGTQMVATHGFGMYCPVSILDLDGNTYLKFWEPTTGNICKIDPNSYLLAAAPTPFTYTTAFLAVSNPVELAQFNYLRVVLRAGETMDISVAAAYDYQNTYVNVGTLVPIDSENSGRLTVNTTDSIYLCRFDTSVRGTAISVKLTGQTSTALKIMHIEVIADPVEYFTQR